MLSGEMGRADAGGVATHREAEGGDVGYSRGADLVADALHLRSHARIAHLVAANHLDRILHVAGVGWFYWNGQRFVRDVEDKLVLATIVATVRELAPDALANRDLLADLKQVQTAAGLAGVARVMSALDGIRASVDDLDADARLLNTANGVLDLRELEAGGAAAGDWRALTLHPHDPAHRMTQMTAAAFDPDADNTTLSSFLHRSLPNAEVRAFLQRLLGVGLLGEQVHHILPILEGAGRNGKGAFYGAVHHALGSYSHVAPSSLFDATKGDPNRPSPAFLELRGRRLVWVSETAKAAIMDSALIKRLTGGDPITGRMLHKNESVTFEPSHQLVLITNDPPRLPADDPAVWARIRRVPWEVVIPPEEQDPALPSKLRMEVDAVLGWMLAGLAAYHGHGLDEPQRVHEATQAYREAQDTVALFIAERCELCDTPDGSGTRELHMAYRGFCRGNAVLPEHTLGEKDFGARLDSLGHTATKGSGGRRFRAGLRLLPDDTDARIAARTAEALSAATTAHEKDAASPAPSHPLARIDASIDQVKAMSSYGNASPVMGLARSPLSEQGQPSGPALWGDQPDGGAK